MSQMLESAASVRDQSDAFERSLALAMKTFAVTPELIDARLAEHKRDEIRRSDNLEDQLANLRRSVEELKGTAKEFRGTADRLSNRIEQVNSKAFELQRELYGDLMKLTIAAFAGVVFAVLLVRFFAS